MKKRKILARIARDCLLLLLLAGFPAWIAWARMDSPEGELEPFELAITDPMLNDGEIVWVDGRNRQDFQRGHIPGAIPLNEGEWDSLLAGLFDAWRPGKTVVVYCSSGCHSSQKIAERLREMGVEPAFYLMGGFEAWKARR